MVSALPKLAAAEKTYAEEDALHGKDKRSDELSRTTPPAPAVLTGPNYCHTIGSDTRFILAFSGSISPSRVR